MRVPILIVFAFFVSSSVLTAEGLRQDKILVGHTERVSSVAWSPKGKCLISGSYDNTIKLWDVSLGKVTSSLEAVDGGWITSVSWCPDGKTIASGEYGGVIRLWDTVNFKPASTFVGHTSEVAFVAWSPSGGKLASIEDGYLALWDAVTQKRIHDFKAEKEWINSMAWNPSGKTLAAGYASGIIRIWSTESHQITSVFEAHSGNVCALAFSPDGKILASSESGSIQLWDTTTYKNITELSGHSCEMITYSHGKFAGQYIPTITTISFNSKGNMLVSGGQDKMLVLWDIANRKSLSKIIAHTDSINAVAWSPDAKQ